MLADPEVSTTDEDTAKKLSYSLHGLQRATLRLDAAHWHRDEEAFTAVAEAVSWAVTLDSILFEGPDRAAYKRSRSSSDDGKTVIGMRFVRNHVHHAAEMLDFVFVNAVVGNPAIEMRAGWLWKALMDLEPFLDPHFTNGKGLYGSHLGGRLVNDSLLDANRFFMSLEPKLPELPPDPTGAPRAAFVLPARWPPLDSDRRI
jgi:hypothetical protein